MYFYLTHANMHRFLVSVCGPDLDVKLKAIVASESPNAGVQP